MSRFIIEGGIPLRGVHNTPGNKNAALPMLAATLLTSEPVTLTNVPLIRDVRCMLELLKTIGATVELDEEKRIVTIQAATIATACLPHERCRQIRTSFLFVGPLLARCGNVMLYPPGGDVIGQRRLDPHVCGFRAMGAEFHEGPPYSLAVSPRLHGAGQHLLSEASVTGTENLVMAAVLADGESNFYNTACEPHVQNLCAMLVQMGADISGIGTNRIVVHGVHSLHGGTFRIWGDYIEAASYLVAAAVTHGSLDIGPVEGREFEVLRRPLERFGLSFSIEDHRVRYQYDPAHPLRIETDLSNAIPKIDDGIWPALPSDLLSVLIVLATQSDGLVTFFEKMFESRLYFVDHLIGMGAQIVHCDPHRVVVRGPSKLRSSVVSSPDIRAGFAMIIAALCAEGRTIINNAESIDRGYEALEVHLAALGANITRQTDKDKTPLENSEILH